MLRNHLQGYFFPVLHVVELGYFVPLAILYVRCNRRLQIVHIELRCIFHVRIYNRQQTHSYQYSSDEDKQNCNFE